MNAPQISLSDLDLPIAASCIMDYHELPVRIAGKNMVVGYLANDDDCENPLTSCDGLGAVYSSHRFSDKHREMQEALGLDTDWYPELDLVESNFPKLAKAAWVKAAAEAPEFIEWVRDHSRTGVKLDVENLKRRARVFWNDEYNYNSGSWSISDFEFTDKVFMLLWRQLREDRKIGDKDVVILDCYDHGGQHWSLSGQGMQCRWDTSNGAGVWVPDDCAREEIDRRAKVYAIGTVTEARLKSKKVYTASIDSEHGALTSEVYEEWHKAFEWLEGMAGKIKMPRRKAEREALEIRGRDRARSEIAKGSLEEYNNWLAGSNFGIVTAKYANTGEDGSEPVWEMTDYESVWGYVGDEYAMEEAGMNVTYEQMPAEATI